VMFYGYRLRHFSLQCVQVLLYTGRICKVVYSPNRYSFKFLTFPKCTEFLISYVSYKKSNYTYENIYLIEFNQYHSNIMTILLLDDIYPAHQYS